MALEILDELAGWDLQPPLLTADAGYGRSPSSGKACPTATFPTSSRPPPVPPPRPVTPNPPRQPMPESENIPRSDIRTGPQHQRFRPGPRRRTGHTSALAQTAAHSPAPTATAVPAHSRDTLSHYGSDLPAEPSAKACTRAATASCWLLVQWPPGQDEPTNYRLSGLPADTTLTDLVQLAKSRWRIGCGTQANGAAEKTPLPGNDSTVGARNGAAPAARGAPPTASGLSTPPSSRPPTRTAAPTPQRLRRPRRHPRRSSTPSRTARPCRSSTLTDTKSPTPPCWPASATPNSRPTVLLEGYGRKRHLVNGDDPARSTNCSPPPSTRSSTGSPRFSGPSTRTVRWRGGFPNDKLDRRVDRGRKLYPRLLNGKQE
jgi:hypothetical protein